jgi:hypothetical protein
MHLKTSTCHPANVAVRLLVVGSAAGQPAHRAAFERVATRLTLPWDGLVAAAPASLHFRGPAGGGDSGGSWNLCVVGDSPGAADETAACYCESVLSATQLLLSLLLPLALVGCAEAQQRWRYAAQQRTLAGCRRERLLARRLGSGACGDRWGVSLEGLRLYPILLLVQASLIGA